MALKTMSIDNLVSLKSQVEAAIASKVSEQRWALESELSKLGRFQPGAVHGKPRLGRGGGRGAVSPKYRNLEKPLETWAGRSLKPRWLVAAIKGGKKIEEFVIAGAATSSKSDGREEARQSRK